MKLHVLFLAAIVASCSSNANKTTEENDQANNGHEPITIDEVWANYNPGVVDFEITTPEAQGAKSRAVYLRQCASCASDSLLLSRGQHTPDRHDQVCGKRF